MVCIYHILDLLCSSWPIECKFYISHRFPSPLLHSPYPLPNTHQTPNYVQCLRPTPSIIQKNPKTFIDWEHKHIQQNRHQVVFAEGTMQGTLTLTDQEVKVEESSTYTGLKFAVDAKIFVHWFIAISSSLPIFLMCIPIVGTDLRGRGEGVWIFNSQARS